MDPCSVAGLRTCEWESKTPAAAPSREAPLRAWTVADALARTRLPLRGQCRNRRARMHAWRPSPASRFNPLADAAGSPRSGEDCTQCRFGSPCASRGFLVGAALDAGFSVICARGQVAWGAPQELEAEAAPTKESVKDRKSTRLNSSH